MVIARLSGEQSFENIYKHGNRLRGVSVDIRYIKIDRSPTRVAVVVSKKISNKATKRNLYKRRLRGCLRDNRSLLPTNGYHIVIAAQPKIKDMVYQEIKQELSKLISKIQQVKL